MNTADTTARTGWFCVRAQTRREHAAALALQQRVGVEVFAPRILISRTRPGGGVMTSVAEALFPGYIFARFQYPHQLRHVVSTRGVTGVVSFGGEPPTVADGVIEFLRAQLRRAGAADPLPVFPAGAWVRVASGCFRDLEGRVLAFDPQTERVRVLLSLLGREIQVSVPAHQLVNEDDPSRKYPAGLRRSEIGAAPVA